MLVADPIAEAGIEALRHQCDVEVHLRQSEAALIERAPRFDAIVVRSETRITEAILRAGTRLRVVARAGVGVDNIDVAAATRAGVIVVNSPEGNTIAAAEHTVAMLLSMSRRIPPAVASLHSGEWARSRFVGVEVCNKTLGVIGFGKIGREVALRARGLQMSVVAHDGFVTEEQARALGVELVDLKTLFQRSDYITVHTPLTRDTKGLLGTAAFEQMKPGVRIINCARGGIVDEAALLEALSNGRVAGAALDVFEQEPPTPHSPLLDHPNVVATPHLGASTEEAQVNVALDVADQIIRVLAGEPARAAVNLPAVSAEVFNRIAPYLELGSRIGRLHAQLGETLPTRVNVSYSGEVLKDDIGPVTRSVLVGLLQPFLAEGVNYVNAPFIAGQRGLLVTESKSAGWTDYTNFIRVEVDYGAERRVIGGTVLGRKDMRIREIDGYKIDLNPEGSLLVVQHHDRPGIIGLVGTMMGDAGVNIAGMYVGREAVGKRAMMVLTIDSAPPQPLLDEIKRAIQADYVRLVVL